MATFAAPFPYKDAYTDSLTPTGNTSSNYFEYRDRNSVQPIGTHVHIDAWRMLEPMLIGIQQMAKLRGSSSHFAIPARLEFFWRPDDNLRGVLIFDSQGLLIVHVVHALLGYLDPNSELSRLITELLGVSNEMFEDIQRAVWGERPYMVVLSREKYAIIDDVETTQPALEIEAEWEWWRVR